jgi:phage tail-like protein
MPLKDQAMLGLGNRFKVSVTVPSPMELGSWAKAEGLDVTFDVCEYRAGDAWNHRWFFPGATKYSTVKLSRAVNKDDTGKVKTWLNDTATKHVPGDIKVVLLDSQSAEVTDWLLRSAMPSKWAITGFDAGSSKLAIETLEIVHLGFLEDDVS